MQDPRSVERLRRGDVATLKRLFKANHAKLYPLAYRLTRNREAAGQIIRQAFHRLWEERQQLDVFEPLHIRLVQRTYAEAMAYRAENGVEEFQITSDRSVNQAASVAEAERIAPEDRLNYVLFVVDGYSFRELALAFGSTVEDVKLSVGRAVASLAEVANSVD